MSSEAQIPREKNIKSMLTNPEERRALTLFGKMSGLRKGITKADLKIWINSNLD